MAGLLVLCAGGHARVVAETALASGRYSEIAFLDDCPSSSSQPPAQLGWPVIGPLSAAHDPQIRHHFPSALVANGDGALRLLWLTSLADAGYEIPVLVHPTAWVSPSARLGAGSVAFAQASVQAQASIGIGAILNTGCSVDHDARLGDGVHLCPGARLAGGVQVGARTCIGIGASVIQCICIGADVTVGAGAAVIHDLPDGVTAVGVPARVIPTI